MTSPTPAPDVVRAARPRTAPQVPLSDIVEWSHAQVRRADVDAAAAVIVAAVTLNTARVLPGDLYVARAGARAHGAQFAAQAVAAGAVAVLTDAAGLDVMPGASAPVPVLVVEDVAGCVGEVAARIYGRPAEQMTMIGVTGTQGKTTTTRLAEEALSAAGVPAAVIGTVGTRVRGVDVPTALTTPEAPDLHGLFARMVEDGVQVCAMEVSSHALVLGRVDGVVFDVAVFTNLGRDHLDFHATVEEYFEAKAELFTAQRARRALVNLDDEHGRILAERAAVAGLTVQGFGLHGDADWTAEDRVAEPEGTAFTVVGPSARAATHVPLPGDFNVANALAALAACAQAGQDLTAVAQGLAGTSGVPGRLERVRLAADFTVIVDYAHKPDAVAAALGTLRPLTEGRLILVIGAGGDRDPGKRPLMGQIGAELADLVIVTDDNPRSEDPALIRRAVVAGTEQVPEHDRAEVLDVDDRRVAIRRALRTAGPGDIVLIAGKGHETGQEIAGDVHPFDDRVVALEEWQVQT